MKNWKTILIVFVCVIGLLPVKVDCGAPDSTCTSAPDENGYYYSSYDIEPIVVFVGETLFHTDFSLKYFTGVNTHRLNTGSFEQ